MISFPWWTMRPALNIGGHFDRLSACLVPLAFPYILLPNRWRRWRHFVNLGEKGCRPWTPNGTVLLHHYGGHFSGRRLVRGKMSVAAVLVPPSLQGTARIRLVHWLVGDSRHSLRLPFRRLGRVIEKKKEKETRCQEGTTAPRTLILGADLRCVTRTLPPFAGIRIHN